MKPQNRYLIYLAYFILTIPVVILFFKFIEPKKLASLFAATLFVSCSLLIFWFEFKNRSLSSLSFLAALGFLVVFSAPMAFMRIVNYDLDFADIHIWGLSGPDFHSYSNYGFWVLMASALIDYLAIKINVKQN